MDVERILQELSCEFPGRDILVFALPENNSGEIVCKIDPTSLHPEHSVAAAVIDRSRPHYHEKTTETYVVEKGTLRLFVDGKEHVLQEGGTLVVSPGQVHFATGEATRVRVESRPGWTSKDHREPDQP